MKRLAQRIEETKVEPGSLAIFWLSQAGFVFKTPSDRVFYVDPYLTDYVARLLPEYGVGFKRITETPIEPEEVEADFIVSTHSHPDHLDMDAIPILLEDPHIHFVGAPDCRAEYDKAGVPEDRYTIMELDQTIDLGDFSVTGVFADHGELAPDALGVVLEVDGIKVWHVGDSAYRPEMWQSVFEMAIDVIIPPINGAFGNLDGVEAARLAEDAHAKVAIPCHFWMFPLHDGDPVQFLEACKEFAPEVQPLLMSHGELFIFRK
jgi:L-ascorbate 6-phosphate lactonase